MQLRQKIHVDSQFVQIKTDINSVPISNKPHFHEFIAVRSDVLWWWCLGYQLFARTKGVACSAAQES